MTSLQYNYSQWSNSLTFLDFMIIHFCQLTNKTQHVIGLKRQSNDETMLLSTGGWMVS